VKARTQVNDPKKGLKEMEEDLKKKTSKKRSDEKKREAAQPLYLKRYD
jgi:hypothetical protein